jgi:hypothetical protein
VGLGVIVTFTAATCRFVGDGEIEVFVPESLLLENREDKMAKMN